MFLSPNIFWCNSSTSQARNTNQAQDSSSICRNTISNEQTNSVARDIFGQHHQDASLCVTTILDSRQLDYPPLHIFCLGLCGPRRQNLQPGVCSLDLASLPLALFLFPFNVDHLRRWTGLQISSSIARAAVPNLTHPNPLVTCQRHPSEDKEPLGYKTKCFAHLAWRHNVPQDAPHRSKRDNKR